MCGRTRQSSMASVSGGSRLPEPNTNDATGMATVTMTRSETRTQARRLVDAGMARRLRELPKPINRLGAARPSKPGSGSGLRACCRRDFRFRRGAPGWRWLCDRAIKRNAILSDRSPRRRCRRCACPARWCKKKRQKTSAVARNATRASAKRTRPVAPSVQIDRP